MLLLSDIFHARLSPDLIAYNASITACEKAGRWDMAMALLSTLQHFAHRPSIVTFNTAITACSHGHQWMQIQQLLDDMRTACLRPDALAAIAPAEALAKEGFSAQALEAYRAAVDAGMLRAPQCGRRSIDLHNYYEEVARL